MLAASASPSSPPCLKSPPPPLPSPPPTPQPSSTNHSSHSPLPPLLHRDQPAKQCWTTTSLLVGWLHLSTHCVVSLTLTLFHWHWNCRSAIVACLAWLQVLHRIYHCQFVNRFKGIDSSQLNFLCLNLIFWDMIGCGIAHFGRWGLETTYSMHRSWSNWFSMLYMRRSNQN